MLSVSRRGRACCKGLLQELVKWALRRARYIALAAAVLAVV